MIEAIEPAVDGGRFPIKRIVGDRVLVQADVFGDGHDAIQAALVYRKPGSLHLAARADAGPATTIAGKRRSRSTRSATTATRSKAGSIISRRGIAI